MNDVIVGAAFTVKSEDPVPVPPSGFVTDTSRTPVVAFAAIVTLAVSLVALTHVVEFTVMPVPAMLSRAAQAQPSQRARTR